jgi:hypothetical protein
MAHSVMGNSRVCFAEVAIGYALTASQPQLPARVSPSGGRGLANFSLP